MGNCLSSKNNRGDADKSNAGQSALGSGSPGERAAVVVAEETKSASGGVGIDSENVVTLSREVSRRDETLVTGVEDAEEEMAKRKDFVGKNVPASGEITKKSAGPMGPDGTPQQIPATQGSHDQRPPEEEESEAVVVAEPETATSKPAEQIAKKDGEGVGLQNGGPPIAAAKEKRGEVLPISASKDIKGTTRLKATDTSAAVGVKATTTTTSATSPSVSPGKDPLAGICPAAGYPKTDAHTSLTEPQRRRLSVLQSPPADLGEGHDLPRGQIRHAGASRELGAAPEKQKDKKRPSFAQLLEDAEVQACYVSGEPAPAGERQHNFENKIESRRGSMSDVKQLKDLGIGHCCKKGLKPESPNQDDFVIILTNESSMFGVFDGHGPYGHGVSNFVQRTLPLMIFDSEVFETDPLKSLSTSFKKTHDIVATQGEQNRFDASLSGTTATVAIYKPKENKIHVAHVGDSRCVKGIKINGEWRATNITNDHKPNNEKELKRITSAGGQVKRLEGDVPFRVFLKGRLYPGLAMSRAIGDTVGSEAGVISDPEVQTFTIEKDNPDLFLMICSDGVWEFIESDEAVRIVSSFTVDKVQEAAEFLAKEAWNRWIHEEGDVVDDITVEIIYLNYFKCKNEKE